MSDTNVLTKLYGIFHLNLAFSSIANEQHGEVVSRCYWPLLQLIEKEQIPLGIELSVYTLEAIAAVDPLWLDKFRELLQQERCELLASGDTQMIGPLIPVEVNRWNQQLGLEGYEKYLGVKPEIAYVNEQAVSRGLLDMYLDMGFSAVVIEWDNPHSLHIDWPREYLFQPVRALTASGRTIPVLWNWSIAFQKLQRLAHGQLALKDYYDFVDGFASEAISFPVYGNDAEVFNFRPGRFTEEANCSKDEWLALTAAFKRMARQYQWSRPSQLLDENLDPRSPVLDITDASHPVVVKKQRKYNLTRWAVSGRNDLWLNTLCHQRYKALAALPKISSEAQKALCRLWASDYRTHLTEPRYQMLVERLETKPTTSTSCSFPGNFEGGAKVSESLRGCFHFDQERNWLTVENSGTQLILNMARGGAIVSLRFADQDEAVLGTLDHGYFLGIELGADFYSNHLVVELPSERRRVADLNEVNWQLAPDGDGLLISMQQDLAIGRLQKQYKLSAEGLECRYFFPDWERPEGSLRLGWLTLLDTESAMVSLAAHYGGEEMEVSCIEQDIDYGQPASTLVSASSCIGATQGELLFGSASAGIKLKWDPAECAAVPMLYNKRVGNDRLSRVFFSLSECDETLKGGGQLLPFRFTVQSWQQGND